MQKNKDKLLNKIVKKNYNNQLEEVLEKKLYEENVKSNLLSILYKIEVAYNDYEKVKQNVETKDEFIENLINDIKNNCETIKFVRPHSEESKIIGNKTFLVEKKLKKIICYPIERKILYSIEKISKNDKIIKDKYFLINITLSDLINVGNNINQVEPLRDFNGYSWTTIPSEIESVEHNLIYQNLIILLGYKFLNNWIRNHEFIIDYMELFENKLDEICDKTQKKNLLDKLEQISILLDIKFNNKVKKRIISTKQKVEKELEYIKDNKVFVEKITDEKNKLIKEIREIDETVNNKDLLQKEYIKRNEVLPLEDKIFSVRILAKILSEERDNKIEKIEKLNDLLKPKNFVKHKKELNDKMKYLKLVEVEDIQKEITKLIIAIQKIFLKIYKQRIENSKDKNEVLQMIYEFRYYNLIPFSYDKFVYQSKELKKELEETGKTLITKAEELNVIDKINKNEDMNYLFLKNIFSFRIISLEDLYIKIISEKDKLFLQVFDEDVYEEKIEICSLDNLNKKDFELKFNKKVKLLKI